MADLTKPGVTRNRDRRKKVLLYLTAVAIAAIVAVGSWQAVRVFTATCGGGTYDFKGECVGVTDGSYVFSPNLKAVESQIEAQNAKAQATGSYVTIALLTPLTAASGSDVSGEQIRQELEGAATAQAYLLQTDDYKPAVRLVLANDGSAQQAWPQVATQLQHWPESQHLIAVTGFTLSNDTTIQAGRQLATSGLPMVGTAITGDGLNSTKISNLMRVAPSVATDVSLMYQYYDSILKSGSGTLSPNAVLVYDQDSDDQYTESLKRDFTTYFRGDIQYTKQYAPGPDQAAELDEVANSICSTSSTSSKPVILYAGRNSSIDDFIQKLRNDTNCPQSDTITIFTGADAANLDATITKNVAQQPAINIIYTSITDTSRLLQSYLTAFKGSSKDAEASWAITTYDAVTAIGVAAAKVAGQDAAVTPGAVAGFLANFNTLTDPVDGATGPFVFTSDGDEGCQWIPLDIDHDGDAGVLSQYQPNCTTGR